MTLGERIRQQKKEKGQSQSEFGKRASIYPKYAGRYKAIKIISSAEKLRVITGVLAVSTDYLLFDNVPKTSRVDVYDTKLLEKFDILDKIQERDRQTVKKCFGCNDPKKPGRRINRVKLENGSSKI